MSITISFTGEGITAIKATMTDFLNADEPQINPAAYTPSPDQQPATAKRGRKPKAATTVTNLAIAPSQEGAVPPVAAPNPAPATASPAVSTAGSGVGTPLGPDAVAPGGAVFLAVKAFNDKHGMEKARELLAKFGAGMVRQIKPSDYEAVIAACAA